MNKAVVFTSIVGAVAIVAGCATAPTSEAALDQQTQAMLKASFRAQGIAKMDRLDQDLAQKACSSDKAPPAAVATQIESEAMASVKWPAGGRYIGDWRKGQKLAEDGKGMAWNNKSVDPAGNGGQCYNCHQLEKSEISYGTVGPSLYNYGKARGVRDVTAPGSAAIVQYTWAKLWNSRGNSACSAMPRFGHMKLLDEDQLRDVMALLLDPKSPVND
jgi:sulfur-oxidizing protein SoxX